MNDIIIAAKGALVKGNSDAGTSGRSAEQLLDIGVDKRLIFFRHIQELVAEFVTLAIGKAFDPCHLGDGFDRFYGCGNGYLNDHAACQRDELARFKTDPTLTDIPGGRDDRSFTDLSQVLVMERHIRADAFKSAFFVCMYESFHYF